MSEKFDPSKHLRNIKGKGGNAEYLDVKWRLVWLRQEHPDATTAVEHIDITPDIAIFKATVTIPGGGSASDYGSETPRDFGDYIEKASTKAMGRALAALGYGTQFVGEELEEGERIVDSPVNRPAPASTGTPAPAAEHPLLVTIRDDTTDPKKRLTALHNYLMAAGNLPELAAACTLAQQAGIPETDLERAKGWHNERITTGKTPAPRAAAPAAPPLSHAG